jgi:formate dehydrogenase iron-sulfur subunit
MHQSSLGSLYLLMPRQLGPQWSTPLLPVNFFLSSIAAGTAVVILIFFAIGKFWRRRTPMSALAALGQITFWSLLVYWAVRLGDMVLRGRLAGAISGKRGLLFAAEIVLGGIVPLLLLARSSTRSQPRLLYWGALLTALGIILNRMNVVLFAMNLTGPMPNTDPRSYFPSIVEWSISIGLIAATIFLFGFAARHMPLLPKEEPAGGH